MKLTHIKQTAMAAALAGLVTAPATINAQPSAHYIPGIEGLSAASLPPPGVYLRDYNYFYYADHWNDANGNKAAGPNPKAFIYAQVPRLIWITDLELLGGYVGVDALVPLAYKSLQSGPFNDATFGVGDPFVEATWSKHIKQFDFAGGFGVWAPTENYNPMNVTWAGSGFWTYMFTAGATWYPDEQKRLSVSVLNRYEINGQQDQTGITPGQVYTVEGGIGYAITKIITLGASGYYQQQTSVDTGTGAFDDCGRVAGIGPEISTFFPSITLGVSLRYAYEFLAESRLQGNTFTLTVTKRF